MTSAEEKRCTLEVASAVAIYWATRYIRSQAAGNSLGHSCRDAINPLKALETNVGRTAWSGQAPLYRWSYWPRYILRILGREEHHNGADDFQVAYQIFRDVIRILLVRNTNDQRTRFVVHEERQV